MKNRHLKRAVRFSTGSSEKTKTSPAYQSQTKTKTTTGSKPAFVDEKFNIIPVKAILPEAEKAEIKPVMELPAFTEADVYFISETATSTLPCLIWPKLTPVPKEMLDKFNHEFYLYCRRKGYDPRDYLFDEMGIAIAGLAIGSYHYKNYKDEYSTPGTKKQDDKLNADFNHKHEIAKQNEEAKADEVKL